MNRFNSTLKIITCLSFILITSYSEAQVVKDGIARMVGDSIEQSFARGDQAFFKATANNQLFMDRVIIEEDDNEKLDEFNTEFGESAIFNKVAEGIINNIQQGADYTFINYYNDEDDNYFLRFRLFGDDGINYHEFLLEFDTYDSYYISDIFIYTTGQYFSETMQGFYKPLVFDLLKDSLNTADSLTFNPQSFMAIKLISAFLKNGKKKQARNLFYKLPENLRSQPFMMQYEFLLVDVEDEVTYANLLDKLSEKSQSRIALYLLGIDRFFISKNYAKALSSLDSLDYYVGDDFLDLHRGNIYYAWDKKDSSEACFLRLEKNYPYYTGSYDVLLEIYNNQKEFDKAVLLLERMNNNLFESKKVVNKIIKKNFSGIKKSAQYKEWLKAKEPPKE